ncbi:MAG: nonstructural protein [Microviridae sp.]|nr:MAG: nonstructural protein [Microviridae sp.]
MKLEVFTVYDRQINAHMQPFFCRTKGEAIRSFTEAVNDPSKPFGKYSTDYSLMCLGEFDDGSGTFVCHDPVRVISANEVIEATSPTAEDPPPVLRRLPM